MTRWKNLFPWMQREVPLQETADETAASINAMPQRAAFADGMPPLPRLDLSRLGSLTAPFVPDAFGQSAPPLNRHAVRLSLALAGMTYTLDILPWMEAGWQDFSFQIDDVLESGQEMDHSSVVAGPEDAAFQQLAALHRMRRAQAALRARNPVVQLLAALRQREGSDTVKTVCMAHPLPDGRHLIAIGFMGTGKRFYDWFSNFRFSDENGFHQGFFQLCSHFEAAAVQIRFPQTASQLGMHQLTLRDILNELARPESRFQLWMAGHSQGGAVMQVFTHRLLSNGALPGHLRGYGFASPTAASAGLTRCPSAYPLWHIQNRDDLVPRIGAQMHLGRCAEYTPDETFRQQVYHASPLPADAACRKQLLPLIGRVRDTADNLLAVTALMRCAAEEKGEDALNLVMDRGRNPAVLDWLYAFAGDRAQSVAKQLEQYQRRMYRELTGSDMDEQALRIRVEQWRPFVASTPMRRILSGLAACLIQPHLLNEDDPAGPGAYSHIVCSHFHQLRPFRWEVPADGAPVKRYAPKPAVSAARQRYLGRGKARLKPQRRNMS